MCGISRSVTSLRVLALLYAAAAGESVALSSEPTCTPSARGTCAEPQPVRGDVLFQHKRALHEQKVLVELGKDKTGWDDDNEVPEKTEVQGRVRLAQVDLERRAGDEHAHLRGFFERVLQQVRQYIKKAEVDDPTPALDDRPAAVQGLPDDYWMAIQLTINGWDDDNEVPEKTEEYIKKAEAEDPTPAKAEKALAKETKAAKKRSAKALAKETKPAEKLALDDRPAAVQRLPDDYWMGIQLSNNGLRLT